MAGENNEGEDVLFTVMVILATGTFFHYNLSKINMPYTVIMFVYGMLLGLSSLVFSDWYDQFMKDFEDIPPRLLFHIFLPVLIFEGSYGLKPHALKNVFRHATILAAPGLVINTLLVGAATKYFVYPEWNWYEVLLLGSILSATDPVAVVTLLKDLGIDANVTAVIDAEALMNDGTAIICFALLEPTLVSGKMEGTTADLIVACVRLTLGAALLGYATGFVMLRVLRQCEGHELITAVQTVAFAYMSFYLADEIVNTSGVLTLFTAGTYLARNYPSHFPGSHTSMITSTWHFLVHALNTVIFCLVGIVIARKSFSRFSFAVLGTMIFMYIVCVLARAAMIVMMMPLMNTGSRWKLTWRECALLTYGGLRGGVATILVLIVMETLDPLTETGGPEKAIGFLHITCGIVVITIVLNATTSAAVVRKLDLQAKPQHRLAQMTYAGKHVNQVLEQALNETKRDVMFRTANWPLVHEIAAGFVDPYEEMTCIQEDPVSAFICIVMRVFKTDVFHQRDQKRCTEDVCRQLIAIAQEHIQKCSLSSVTEFVPLMEYPAHIKWLEKCCTFEHAKQLVLNLKKRHDTWFFGLLLSYGEALTAIEKVIPEYADTVEQVGMIQAWMDRERQEMSHLISIFQEEKPLATVAVFTAIAAASVMKEAEEAVQKLHHEKGFSQFDTDQLAAAIEAMKRPIPRLKPEIDPPTPEDIFSLSQIGMGISDLTLNMLARTWSVHSVGHDREVDIGRSVGVIIKGIANLVAHYDAPLVPGSVWGAEVHVLSEGKAPMIVTTTDVTYLTLSPEAVQQWMADDPHFADNVRVTAARAIAEDRLAEIAKFAGADENKLEALCHRGSLIVAPTDNYIPPPSDNEECITLFIRGSDHSGLIPQKMQPLVVPRCATFKWTKDTVLFRVETGFNKNQTVVGGLHQRRVRVPETIGAGDDAGASREFAISTEMRAATSSFILGNLLSYSPTECATPVPYFNRFQLRFVVAMEQLKSVADVFATHPTYERRRDLLLAMDHTLQFLSRYCVNIFPKESYLYKRTQLPTWDTEHKPQHETFQSNVSMWLERRALDDRLFHNEVIEGMSEFVKSHFPLDSRDSNQWLTKFIPIGILQSLNHPNDFEKVENHLKLSEAAPADAVSKQ